MRRDVKNSIIALCAKNKAFPNILELMEYTEVPPIELRAELERLCETKFIEKLPSGKYVLNPYTIVRGSDEESFTQLPEIAEPEPEPEIHVEKIFTQDEVDALQIVPALPKKKRKHKQTFIQETSMVPSKTEFDIVIPAIRISMLIIGIGAVIVSIFYTSVWLVEFLPLFLALLLASIMVCFSVMSFEVIVLFLSGDITKHWTRWIVVSGFSALWIVVAAFSITSTVAGQYNQHIKNSAEYAALNKDALANNAQLKSIQERKAELIERRTEKKLQLTSLINIASQAGTIESAEKHSSTLSTANYRAQQAEQSLNQIETDLEKIRVEERKILGSNKASSAGSADVPDFYLWLAGVLGWKKDVVQFWLSLFPAIFVDLIAPAALSISAFLKKRKV